MIVCSVLIFVAVNTDVQRIKLDTAADFSSRVQHLETTISKLETMATILSQTMTYTVDYHGRNNNEDVLDYFSLEGELLTLNYIDENYLSGLYARLPINQQERQRLALLLKTGPYLPHFLQEEKLEKVTIYNYSPTAKLVYPNNGLASKTEFQTELNDGLWEYFWQAHQHRNILWKLIKVNNSYKLSLTVSILDPEQGLVGLIQFLFSQNVFDQDIYQPSGPDSLVFLSELSENPLLIATTEYEDNEVSIGKKFVMEEGKELPQDMQILLKSVDDWVYQSDDYFLLSVRLASAFNLVYLTDSRGFSFLSSRLLKYGIVLLIILVFIGVFVERMVYRNLTVLKQKDDVLTMKNQQLTEAFDELEETHRELIQKEKIASLSNVVAGLAHQLNTPLSVAITAASYLTESLVKVTNKFNLGIKKSELEDFLVNTKESSLLISNNLDKSRSLVDNFKLLANEDSEDQLNLFSVVEYTKAVVQGLKPKLDERRIKLKINAESDIQVCNYSVPYTQIIVQLVNNAVLHGVEHDGNITINVAKDQDRHGVVVDILDDGKGIKKSDIDRVFEPFFTSKCAAEQMGLGLSIVHNLISGKMSGEIKVSSELGKGCCFSLYFPSLTSE